MLSTRLLSPLRHSVAAVRMGEPQDTVETVETFCVVSVVEGNGPRSFGTNGSRNEQFQNGTPV